MNRQSFLHKWVAFGSLLAAPQPMNQVHYLKPILLPTLMLLGCMGKKESFDTYHKISSLGKPNRIEFYYHVEEQAFQYQAQPQFVIAEASEIESAPKEIQNAENPKPFKGAGWDRIILDYGDTVIKINTDTKKIGLSASGTFYSLSTDNFMTRRIRLR